MNIKIVVTDIPGTADPMTLEFSIDNALMALFDGGPMAYIECESYLPLSLGMEELRKRLDQ